MLHIFPPTTALRWLKHLWPLFLKEIKERTLSEKQGNSMTCIKYCQYRHIVLTSLISSCPQRLAQIIFVVHTSLYGPLDNNSLENSCLTANDANWRKKKTELQSLETKSYERLSKVPNDLPPLFFVEQQDYQACSEDDQEDTQHSTNCLTSPWKAFIYLGFLIRLAPMDSWSNGWSNNINREGKD